jgi:hypothetical protein
VAAAPHRLEQRSRLLASRLSALRDDLRASLAAPGERPPFTEAMSESAALDWWAAHRYDQYGMKVLQAMPPDRIAQLDAALTARAQARLMPEMENADAA